MYRNNVTLVKHIHHCCPVMNRTTGAEHRYNKEGCLKNDNKNDNNINNSCHWRSRTSLLPIAKYKSETYKNELQIYY